MSSVPVAATGEDGMKTKPAKAIDSAASRDARRGPHVPKMAEFVLQELRRQIVTGEYVEGSNLPTEGQLVERFGVSRTPVREAIRALEFEGLIDSRQGARNGAFVQSPSARIAGRHTGMLLRRRGASLADVYQARLAIEPFAARLLAQSASAEAIGALKALYEAERRLVDEPIAWGRAAEAFHQGIVEHCGNHTLAVLSAQLHDIVAGQIAIEMAETGASPNPADRNKADAAHGRLIGLVERHDGDRAESYWRAHLEAAWPWHTATEALSVDELLSDKRPAPAGADRAEARADALKRKGAGR
jgi:GntR family transcriptional repressor for pyruvate dehydrogenase complex